MFQGMKDMGKLMKQAKEMKEKMKTVQQELKREKVVGSSEGGDIRVEMNGEMEVLDLIVADELFAKPEKLKKGIVKAFNDASGKAKKVASSKLSSVSAGLNIPGLT